MWKFHDFCIIQILCEINFEDSWRAKSAILSHLEALNFDILLILHFLKAEIYQMNKNHSPWNGKKGIFCTSRIHKLISRKILVIQKFQNFHTVFLELLESQKLISRKIKEAVFLKISTLCIKQSYYSYQSTLSHPGPSSAPLGQSSLSSQTFLTSTQTPLSKFGHCHFPGGQVSSGVPQPLSVDSSDPSPQSSSLSHT